MDSQFNLVDKPWIPCIRQDGQVVELSLRDTLAQAHTLRELGGESPLVTVALHRLLLAILHRVYGPQGYDAWHDLWTLQHWQMGTARRLSCRLARTVRPVPPTASVLPNGR